MPFAPLVSKIRCHSPNKPGTKNANRNNVTYIATRSGVDISELKDKESIDELIREHEKVCKTNINEEYLHKSADNDTYLRYMAERPRSHGLFGNIDTSDLDKVSSDIYNYTKQGKNIYRGIISLSQKDAELLNFTNKDSWNTYLKSVMPDIAKELGISSINFTWVGAFHAEKNHPHVHYQLWDNRDIVKSPFIHKSRQSNIRLMLSNEMFSEEYEKFVKELTAPERESLTEEKNKARDDLNSYMKAVFIHLTEFIPGVEGNELPSKINNVDIQNLSNQLITLVDHLKDSGRLDYKLVKPHIKTEVNQISDFILNQREFKLAFNKFVEMQGEISKLNGRTKFEINMDKDIAKNDLYTRMGNIILKSAKKLINHKDKITNLNNSIDSNIRKNEDNTNLNDGPADRNLNDAISVDQVNTSSDYLNDNAGYNDAISNFEKNEKSYSNSLWDKDLKEAMKEFYDNRDYVAAIKAFEKCANNGNPIALEKLGMIYSKGIGVEIDNIKADNYYKASFQIYNRLLNNSNDKMEIYINYRLGKMFENGLGTDIDYESAKVCYGYAADCDNKFAMYSLGKMYLDGKGADEDTNIEKYKANSITYIKESADLKFGYAAYQTGLFYKQGLYTNQDEHIANDYFKVAYSEFTDMLKSYEDDNVLYRVGQMTYDGVGTEKNIHKAIEYLEKSMELKNENATLFLARIYIEMNEVDKLNIAIDMLSQLSDNGNLRASYSLGRIYATENNSFFSLEKSIHYYELANQDNEHAQYGLGKIYADNKSDYYDEKKALYYLNLSAEHNNSYAQYSLGKLYSQHDNSHYDMNKAIEYFKQSADNGNEHGAYSLGTIYADKEQSYCDIEKAVIYLDQAASNNHLYAILKLGQIYENPENINYYNQGKSNEYYQKAYNILEEKVATSVNYSEYNQLANLYLDGKGTSQDIRKGLNYLYLSALNNDSNAQYKLGRMYLWGDKVEKDEEKGLKFLKQAEANSNPYAKEAIQFYNDFKDRQGNIVAYDIFKVIHAMFTSQNRHQQSTYNTLKAFRNRSKQAIKEEAMRQRVQGAKYENES